MPSFPRGTLIRFTLYTLVNRGAVMNWMWLITSGINQIRKNEKGVSFVRNKYSLSLKKGSPCFI